jgi:hypothetical protein
MLSNLNKKWNIFRKEADKILDEYIASEQFQLDIEKDIIKHTWDKGLPKCYTKDGWLIKEWKDGTKHKIKLNAK